MRLDKLVRKLPFGKRTQSAYYVHVSAIKDLPEELFRSSMQASKLLSPRDGYPDLIKWSLDGEKVSFLYYPEFFDDPHPRLWKAITIKFDSEGGPCLPASRKYDWRKNPPILHRKELFLPAGHERREEFEALTKAEEEAGLLSSHRIGTLRQWRALLLEKGVRIDDHELVSAQ